IYVTYWHGQLDIIPTAIFVLSLFLLRQGRTPWSLVVFGLALATKTHLLAALPFLLIYIFQKEHNQRLLMKSFLVCAGTYLAGLFPFVMSPAFGRMVFATEEQARLIALQVSIGKTEMAVLVAPAAMLLLWFRFVAYRETNWDLLMLYLGILFSVFMLLAPPAPGYVLWSLPFLVHFVCRGRQTDSLPFVCYTAAYLAFFWLRPGSDLLDAFRVVSPRLAALGDPNQFLMALNPALVTLLQKASFTLMEASLAGMILFMNVVGVRRNDAHRASAKPIMIGVSGDSGAGKDTFSELLKDVLGEERVTVVAGDDYHRWPRGHERWQVYTHLDVRANNLYEHQEHALAFSLGRSVIKGTYDHNTGRFTEERMVDPSEVMVFQGLHSLSTDAVREMYDLKIFLNPDEDLRKLWKVQRDFRDRGHEPARVLQSIDERERDRNLYLLPQLQQADLIFRWKPVVPVNPWDLNADPELELELLAANSLDLTAVVNVLGRCTALKTEHLPFVDTRWQRLRLTGSVPADVLQAAALQLGHELRPSRLRSGLPGCAQLITLAVLRQKLLWRRNPVQSVV
ncbi:MAG: hypothetical protein JOY79_02660, partial [Acidobacteriaceae bacterium]|nr:hypothetical protein [Acidobacteriaceae bacterium]